MVNGKLAVTFFDLCWLCFTCVLVVFGCVGRVLPVFWSCLVVLVVFDQCHLWFLIISELFYWIMFSVWSEKIIQRDGKKMGAMV